MKASRSIETNFNIPTASTIKYNELMTNPSPISSTEYLLKCCPIDNTFNIVGKRFTVLILRNMINSKQNRFNQLLNSIKDCNPKTLSIRLRQMEKYGLIRRKVYPNEKPVRVEYQPTEKGLAFQPILDMMAAYSLRYYSRDVFKDGKPREFKEVYGREIKFLRKSSL
jgi:DNA-binding HxlR family transcriptional regulator